MIIKREAAKKLSQYLDSGKIVVVLGARQVGKTTLLRQFLSSKNALMLNFDIAIDAARFKAASVLPPSDGLKTLGNPDFLVIDEAQREPDTARIVKGWYDAGVATKIVLLGSSSMNLQSQSESLTGRNRKIHLMPFTVSECLLCESWYREEYTWDILQNHFGEQFKATLVKSMVFGCYPEVVVSEDKETILRDLAADYLWKDILHAGLVKTPDLIKRLLMLLAYQSGSEVSVNEIAQQLQLARATVERYLDLLEETFVIFRLHSFSTNPQKEISKGKKVFFWDTGIRNAILNSFACHELRNDIGQLFENFLIAEIMKRNTLQSSPVDAYFWRTVSRSEVDLVLKRDGELLPFEMKWGYKHGKSNAFKTAYGAEVKTLSPYNPADWPL